MSEWRRALDYDFAGTGSCSEQCGDSETCLDGRCISACAAAEQTKDSVGCEYYATYMDLELAATSHCFAAMVLRFMSGSFRGGVFLGRLVHSDVILRSGISVSPNQRNGNARQVPLHER